MTTLLLLGWIAFCAIDVLLYFRESRKRALFNLWPGSGFYEWWKGRSQ